MRLDGENDEECNDERRPLTSSFDTAFSHGCGCEPSPTNARGDIINSLSTERLSAYYEQD